MKKFLYILSILSVAFLSSCDNKAIPESIIDPPENKYSVDVTVSLSNFFQCYDFQDNLHSDVPPLSEYYRTFNSEYGLYIEARTLIYNNNTGLIVDSLLTYSKNTNPIKETVKLPRGKFTAITTLSFAIEYQNKFIPYWWNLIDQEKLSTVKFYNLDNESPWSILSCSSIEFEVNESKSNSISLAPSPVGAICYFVMENFHTTPEDAPLVVDNGIRFIKIYTQKYAYAYYLDNNMDPSDRFVYANATEHNYWIPLDEETPSEYNDDWIFFEGNGGLCSWFYILAPQCNIEFGYILDGEESFHDYGEANYTIQSGKTYLAIWDYLYVGNPYFGLADNNHWDRSKSSIMKSTPNGRMMYLNKDHINGQKDIKAIR